jgi:glycosyltransferase involved in cell wall biosynthesis
MGGQSRLAWELAQKALDEKNEVHLIARRFLAGFKDPSIENYRIFQWPRPFGENLRFRTFAFLSSTKAKRLATEKSVIHGFGDSYRQDILTLGNVDWNYAKLIPGRKPSSVAVHIKKKAFLDPGLQFLVLVSEQQRKEVLDLLPHFDQDKIRVIYPGVDTERFARYSRDEIRGRLSREFGIPLQTTWLVFAAGGDFEKRNLATLGKALIKLHTRTDWSILFVGGNKDQIPWPKELANRSFFLGRLDDIGTVLPGCDFMVYPAWYDEFALVCLEAMASGLPLLVSQTVGVSEILSDLNKASGVLEHPGDVEKLTTLIVKFLSSPSLRQRVSADNRIKSKTLTWGNFYNQYKVLYEKVSASRQFRN